MVLRRLPGYYVTYLYVPAVVIIAASLFTFHLPPGSDAKVDLAVTGLLSQTVFLLLISELMPPDAFNPPFLGSIPTDIRVSLSFNLDLYNVTIITKILLLLGRCLSILLIIQASAVIVTVIIKRIHDDSRHKTKPPGRWLLKAMHYLKYPLFLNHIDYSEDESTLAGSASPSISTQLTTASIEVTTPINLCVRTACFVVPIVTISMLVNDHHQDIKLYLASDNNLLMAFPTAAIRVMIYDVI